jgi:hypothetical protein
MLSAAIKDLRQTDLRQTWARLAPDVYCDDAGVSVFDKLHSRAYDDRVILYAFDLLELDGVDRRPNPWWLARVSLRGPPSCITPGIRDSPVENPRGGFWT